MNQPRHTDSGVLGVRVTDPHAGAAVGCDPFPSLGEIGLLIVATAAQNLTLTRQRTAKGRGGQANDVTDPRSH
ncbi:hypothetical protein [Streptomyces sp. NPDC057302]|uniref:hypothetical protein n=1 Tax=Streptomyces sp. NPDC057302 TaxID=3346094 RepID=UPI00363132DC